MFDCLHLFVFFSLPGDLSSSSLDFLPFQQYGDTSISTLDKLQEDGKFKAMLDECYAGPDPKNPPFIGLFPFFLSR